MKKSPNENDDLFLETVRQKISVKNNYFKNNCLYLSAENITVTELGEIFRKQVSEIISFFWNKGQVISKNQALSFDLLKDYCKSIRVEIKKSNEINFGEIISEYLKKLDNNGQLVERPPIVSIMGHIDHGKTTLLDTIRQTNLQSKEIGGITQKITVSQVDFQGKKITFLDTPGHSDFIKMRQRGISLTDIVVLIIDANDGIMFQTEEIIDYLRKYQIPVIVFINHKRPEQTDNETNLNRIRAQLQEKGLNPLEWEGETIVISGSAKKKEDTNNLLENILLVADYKSNSQHPTNGVVIDHYLHPKTGSTITELLVQEGNIQEKDNIFLNGKFSKAKMIYNLYGEKIATAYSSTPVQVIGLTSSAELGDRFLVTNNDNIIKSLESELTPHLKNETKINPPPVTKEKKNINLVLLADSQNSLEALMELIRKKKSSECSFWIISTAIGKLNDSTLDSIKVTHSTVLAFGLQPNQEQIKFFKENNISFFSSRIIYEIADKIEEIIGDQQKVEEVEEVVGEAVVEKTFYFSKVGQIAGCQVVSGKINRNNRVHVLRDRNKEKVFTGSIQSLESNKEKKSEVISGYECGIVLSGFNDFCAGDKIIAFQMTKKNVSPA